MPFCGECGTKLTPGAKFCPNCGHKVEAPAGAAPAAKPAAKPAKKSPAFRKQGGSSLPPKVVASGALSKHEDFEVYDINMRLFSKGTGMRNLHTKLSDSECLFVFFHMHAQFDKAIVDIETVANIVLQWKGKNASGMKKVKSNGALQKALDSCPANKGYIEVLGLKNLSSAVIYDRWAPGSGSKVIQD